MKQDSAHLIPEDCPVAPLVGARGLKQMQENSYVYGYRRAPRGGAWIETHCVQICAPPIIASRPSWGRVD